MGMALAQGGGVQGQLVDFLTYVEGLGAIAPIAFIVFYALITVAFLPASIATLGAGVIFGVVQGSAIVFVGAMAGAIAAFLIGRYGARGWVSRRIQGYPRFRALDSAIAQEGRKIIFLLRLSPLFPFNLLNYGLGLTQISLGDYVVGTLGILPGTVMYVYLGSLAGSLATLGAGNVPQDSTVTWVIRILALGATVAVTLYGSTVARRALATVAPEVPDTP